MAAPNARPCQDARRATRARRGWAALGLALALMAAGPAAGAVELTVSAASSLGVAMQTLLPRFEARHPGVRTHLNLAASGTLLQQLAQGAPVDVLASADHPTMQRAVDRGLVVRSSVRDFARNRLVLAVPLTSASGGSASVPRRAEDLLQPGVRRVAIGLPASVPAGRYARDALVAAGLWTQLQPKVVGALNVRQALDYVARGEVDAAFVYATDARLLPERVQVAFELPTSTPVRYPAGVVSGRPHPDLAQTLVDFLAHDAQARQLLSDLGFGAP